MAAGYKSGHRFLHGLNIILVAPTAAAKGMQSRERLSHKSGFGALTDGRPIFIIQQ